MAILTAHLSDRSMVRSTSALVSQRVRVRVRFRPNPTLSLPLPLPLTLTLPLPLTLPLTLDLTWCRRGAHSVADGPWHAPRARSPQR